MFNLSSIPIVFYMVAYVVYESISSNNNKLKKKLLWFFAVKVFIVLDQTFKNSKLSDTSSSKVLGVWYIT